MAEAGEPEFSRPLALEAVPGVGEIDRTLTASEAECAAVARRLDLQALRDFRTEMTVQRLFGAELCVRGRVSAEVVQSCVVTLEPVPDQVDETFEVRFTTDPEPEPHELAIGPEDEEPAEPISGDSLDLGELAVQQLALALNPWPRLADAKLPEEARFDPARDGPFAALAAWRRKAAESEE